MLSILKRRYSFTMINKTQKIARILYLFIIAFALGLVGIFTRNNVEKIFSFKKEGISLFIPPVHADEPFSGGGAEGEGAEGDGSGESGSSSAECCE